MDRPFKTPGVYIAETSAFPNSVVGVATAVPVFIGYTEKAEDKGHSLRNRPWRITSLAEFHLHFGRASEATFKLETSCKGRNDYTLTQASGQYLLHNSMRLFYQNGGGPCYIVSVGDYGDQVEADKLKQGIDLLITESEPTLLVIPEAVLLDEAQCISVQQAAIAHCGHTMKNRFAILDIHDGYRARNDASGDCIEKFRNAIGSNSRDYAAAYYPWLNTNIVQDNELSYENIHEGSRATLQRLLNEEVTKLRDKAKKQATAEIEKLSNPPTDDTEKKILDNSLRTISPQLYGGIMKAIRDKLNLLPPSAAMAGVYTMVDNARGVWKAPANVSVNAVISPSVNISHDEQEDLNVTVQGTSINAIRSFVGEGVLVWGARTLDGNSLDWRYVSVRRTAIMLEESIKLAIKAFVFEKNNATTWLNIKSMISNFLTTIWKSGGLAGASPSDAFNVSCGLGETMTSEDVLQGTLRVTVQVAITRPAEFIVITFEQQMQ